MDFLFFFLINGLLIIRGCLFYRVRYGDITLFQFFRKILAFDMAALISIFNIRLIKKMKYLNLLTILLWVLFICILVITFI